MTSRGVSRNSREWVSLRPPGEAPGNLGECFALIDADYSHLSANGQYCETMGTPLERVLGMSVAEVWGDALFNEVLQAPLMECFSGDEIHFETRFSRLDRGLRNYEVSMYPLERLVGVSEAMLLIRDVTGIYRAQQEVHLMLELIPAVKEAPDFQSALKVSLEKICKATNWVLAHGWIPSEDGSNLDYHSVTYAPEGSIKGHFSGIRFRKFEPESEAHIWNSGTQVRPEDLLDLPLDLRKRGLGLRKAAAIPVMAGGKVVTMMEFFTERESDHDEQLMTAVTTVAAQLGSMFQRKQIQEQLDRFFDRSQDMNCIVGYDGYLKRVNQSWQKTFGLSPDELMKTPVIALVSAEERPKIEERFEALKQGLVATSFEVKCRCRDGSWKLTLWNATSVPGQSLIIATGRDITESKRAEEALRQSEEHYRELFQQAYQMQQSLRKLSDKLLRVQEEERTRLSHELHDEVGQALTAISVQLAVLEKELPDAPKLQKRIGDAQQVLEATQTSVHNFARELRPAMLDDLGLIPAVRTYLKCFAERMNIEANLVAEGEPGRLGNEQKTVIFRLVQEALNNTAKHAEASSVEVRIEVGVRDARICITDNGKGFEVGNPSNGVKNGHLGLLGMQERVRLANGRIAIQSNSEKGTTISVELPLKSP